jgi:hypothetical protein
MIAPKIAYLDIMPNSATATSFFSKIRPQSHAENAIADE